MLPLRNGKGGAYNNEEKKDRCILSALIMLAAALAGCRAGASDKRADLLSGGSAVAPLSPDAGFSAAYTDLALKLLSACLEDGKNTLVSPLSVMEALAMASNGASGRTLDELMSVIGGGIGTDDLTAYLRGFSLDSDLVRMSNSVWIRDGFAVRKSFLEKNGGLYGAGVFTAPFDDSTVDAVNAWINAGTNGMIGKMLERGALNDSDICLCNAVFFDGRWVQTYKDENIVDGLFRRADGTTDRVTMLRSEAVSYTHLRAHETL